jgi:transcriptional regulator with XRE-family HTH domain
MRKARTIRESAGLGIRDVAEQTGIDIGSLSKFERAQVGLSLPTFQKLAAFYTEKLGRVVTIDELIADAPPQEAPVG